MKDFSLNSSHRNSFKYLLDASYKPDAISEETAMGKVFFCGALFQKIKQVNEADGMLNESEYFGGEMVKYLRVLMYSFFMYSFKWHHCPC